MDLSIILPVYNVEKYIRPCVESIFKQGLDDTTTEIIIVNDGTKDKSIEMISDIISLHENIKIINQENQGLSVARNNGITKAKGEYILMLDSDDLLIDNSLKKLLDLALTSKADLVVADFLYMTSKEIEQINTSLLQQTVFEYKKKNGKELFLQDLNPYQCYVWRTLYKRDFLIKNDLMFIPGIYIQDLPFTHECYLKANNCIRTSWLLNIYRHGHSTAASTIFNKKKALDFCIAIAKTWELINLKDLSAKELDKLLEDVNISFSCMISRTVHEIKNKSDRFDIIDSLKKQVPNLYFRNGIKQIIISYLFRHFPHFYISLRYLYGIIFEERIRPFYYQRVRRLFPLL
jgi:glycosyltransferase involved in cell wall biosynthesis